MKNFTDQSGGVKINYRFHGGGYGCPSWARGFQKEDWEKQGVIVWDEATQRIEHLFAEKALRILEQLRATEDWESTGFPITGTTIPIRGEPKSKSKRSKKQGAQPETPPPSPAERKPEMVGDERFRLTPNASAEFLEFLTSHQATLQEMAEAEAVERNRILTEVYSILLKAHHRSELEGMDLSTRPLPWTSDKEKFQLVCDLPPRRGLVMPENEHWFWEACIEQADHLKSVGPFFFHLEEALNWVEEELAKPLEVEKADEPDDKPAPLTPEQLDGLRPYWIEPTALEPERLTYRIVLDLDSEPVHFKTMKMSFGREFQYDKEYLPPTLLARELNLDADQLEIEQLLGQADGWYRIKSLVTYLNETLAISQAQQVWDKSQISKHYKAGKLTRAWYGIEEVETKYLTILGACDKPDSPWLKRPSRVEHMQSQALRETIVQAADVVAFRSFLGLSQKDVSDAELLETLHEQRAQSKHTPAEARMESQRWLRQRTQRVK